MSEYVTCYSSTRRQWIVDTTDYNPYPRVSRPHPFCKLWALRKVNGGDRESIQISFDTEHRQNLQPRTQDYAANYDMESKQKNLQPRTQDYAANYDMESKQKNLQPRTQDYAANYDMESKQKTEKVEKSWWLSVRKSLTHIRRRATALGSVKVKHIKWLVSTVNGASHMWISSLVLLTPSIKLETTRGSFL